jgi:integrase
MWYADMRREGHRVYVPLGHEREAAVVRMALLAAPGPVAPHPLERTFDALARRWELVTQTRVKPITMRSYLVALAHAQRAFGPRDVTTITAADIEEFEARMIATGSRPLYALRCRKTALMVLRFAVDAGILVGAPRPRPRRRAREERPWFTPTELADIWASAPVDRRVAALRFLAASGLRAGELVALCGADIDRTVYTVRVRTTKTAAGVRVVSLPAGILELVPFTGPEERAWDTSYKQLLRVWHDCLDLALRPHCGLHSLRHSNAAWRVASGHDLQWVANQLGHSSPVVTLGAYGHLIVHPRQDISGLSTLA